MTVISIQSQVVHGHVGNSAAVFPLQACGIEVAAVPTALLSNHPHYSSMRGGVLDAKFVRELLAGVEERGLVDTCKVLISGYLGSPEIAAAVIDFVRRAKARNPKLLYLCDPVMGDAGPGFYVDEDLRALFCEGLVPLADIIAPNQFELEQLVGRAPATVEGIVAAARGLGPSTVAVTGVQLQDASSGIVQTLAIEPRAAWMVSTPRLPAVPPGPAISSPRFSPPRWCRASQPERHSAAPSPASTAFSRKRNGGSPMNWHSLIRRSACCVHIPASSRPASPRVPAHHRRCPPRLRYDEARRLCGHREPPLVSAL